MVTTPAQEGPHDEWFGLAPLATPESLSEVSSISSRASWLLAEGPAAPAPPPPPPPSASTPSASASASASTSASASGRPATSSGDDLSFLSARQTTATATSSDDCRRSASTDAFLSVHGTPSSSDDSVTATVEVHRPRACAVGGACSDSPAAVSLPTPARCPQSSPLPPAGARPASVTDVTAPNSVKQVKFTQRHRGSTVTASAVRQAIDCDRVSRGDIGVAERLDNNSCCSENNNNNNDNGAKTSGGCHAQQNSARSTPAAVRSRRDCRADRQALESLPLLSSIAAGPDGVTPYPRKKYMYPITAVGKGESSV